MSVRPLANFWTSDGSALIPFPRSAWTPAHCSARLISPPVLHRPASLYLERSDCREEPTSPENPNAAADGEHPMKCAKLTPSRSMQALRWCHVLGFGPLL